MKIPVHKPRYLIFDFDGTIADTIDLAIETYNTIAPEFKCKPVKPEDRDMLFAEKPQKFMKKYGVTAFKLFFLVLRMRKEMEKRISEVKPMANIDASLRELKNAGFRLGILTSNSRENAGKFLENNKLQGIFDFIYSGSNLFGKDRIIKRLLRHEHISKENAIYIGDETRDIEASKKAGIPVIAVCWGLTKRDILSALRPNQIAGKPGELLICAQRIFGGSISQLKSNA